MNPHLPKRITTLTGPSCAGKSTLEALMAEKGCMKAISTTTRLPRAGEIDGVDYYFVSDAKFATMLEIGSFVEHVEFGQYRYALSSAEVQRLFHSGDHIVIVCEPNGAKQINRYFQNDESIHLTQVFVDNPQSVINERFLKRVVSDSLAAAVSGAISHEKIINDAAKRLTVMMSVENEWHHHRLNYDINFVTFDKHNQDEVVNRLTGPISPDKTIH